MQENAPYFSVDASNSVNEGHTQIVSHTLSRNTHTLSHLLAFVLETSRTQCAAHFAREKLIRIVQFHMCFPLERRGKFQVALNASVRLLACVIHQHVLLQRELAVKGSVAL